MPGSASRPTRAPRRSRSPGAALLRRHHPDVAGPEGLEQAKRINVAHDWLSDPALRARYDRERGLRHGIGPRGDGHRTWHARDGAGPAPRPRPPRTRTGPWTRRRASPGSSTGSRRSRPTEIDRLALAEPPPIAFGATIRRFLPPEQRAALDEVETAVDGRLPAGRGPPDDPRRDRRVRHGARPRPVPRRAPDRAVPRARPRAAHARLGRRRRPAAVRPERRGRRGAGRADRRGWTGPGSQRLAETGTEVRGTTEPWPPDVSPGDEDALRISATLAARDAARRGPGRARRGRSRSRARLAAGRLAHLLVLRHAFAPAAFEGLTGPWRPVAAAGRVRAPRPSPGRRSLT